MLVNASGNVFVWLFTHISLGLGYILVLQPQLFFPNFQFLAPLIIFSIALNRWSHDPFAVF